jgi:membrane-associated phospholipid phosphatase
LETLKNWILPSQMKRRIWPLALGVSYILLIYILGGLRTDHIFIGLLSLLDYYNQKTRIFLKYFFAFILTGAVYDFMRYFYWQVITHEYINVKEPYYRDLYWFGIYGLTPNEFFEKHHWKAMDLISGLAYLTFVFEYLGLGFYLFAKNHLRLLWAFGWTFFVVNVLGYLVYFIYPAAPPWYITKYGFEARFDVRPDAGAAVRFDKILGTHFFDQMYGRGVDVYGAYPSLHVAYPLLVCWIVFTLPELKWARIPAALFYFLMCFSAIYLQHHFIVDIILGTGLAMGVAMLTTWLLRRSSLV